MNDNTDTDTDNFVLRQLQAIRASQLRMEASLSRTKSDVQDIKRCLGNIEKGLTEGFLSKT